MGGSVSAGKQLKIGNLSFGQKTTVLLAAILSWSSDGIGLSMVTFLGTPIMHAYSIGSAELGIVFSAQYAAAVAGAIIFGRIADRFGRRKALIYSIVWFTVVISLSGFAPNYGTFLALRIIGGLGNSWGIAFSLLSESYSPKHRGFFGGILQSTFVVGYVISAITVKLLYNTAGWRPLFLVTLVLLPFVIVLALFMPESVVWKEYMSSGHNGAPSNGRGLRELLHGKLLRLTVLATVTFWSAEFAYHSLVDWMPTFLQDVFSFPVPKASSTIIPISLFIMFVLPFFGYLSDKRGRRPIFSISAMIGLTGTVLLGYFSVAQFNVGLSIATMYLITMGFGSHALFGIWSGEMFPTRVRATVTSFIFAAGRALSIGGFLVGLMTPSFGLAVSMVILGIIGFSLMISLPWFLPETKGKVISAIDEEPEPGPVPLAAED